MMGFSRRQLGMGAAAAALALTLGVTAQARDVVTGQPAPDFTATDSNGVEHSLSDFADGTVVLEWTNHDCPFVKKHYTKSTNMQALQEVATAGGVTWLKVVSSAPGRQGHVTAEEANAIEADRGSNATAVLLDPTGDVGRLYGAKTTPHMYVINEGALVYQGAIDSNDSARASAIPGATNYVADALAAIAAGQSPAVTETEAYGCSVKYAKS